MRSCSTFSLAQAASGNDPSHWPPRDHCAPRSEHVARLGRAGKITIQSGKPATTSTTLKLTL